MGIIKALKLGFDYQRYDDDGNVVDMQRAVNDVNLDIEAGEFVAVLGHNGSGKSTLAKHMNALLIPTEGTMLVDGIDTARETKLWKVRQKAGMVFQNPDNQIIGTVVEEDVGFGPENMGIPTDDIWKRVDDSLEKVGMTAYRYQSPNKLSGGQKQRVAIAGVMAMRPRCIILDEPTAFLDVVSRIEIMTLLHRLAVEQNKAILLSTHDIEQALVLSDKLWLLSKEKGLQCGVTEDMILSHQMDNLFSHSNIRFDYDHGIYYPTVNGKQEITVEATDETLLHWTINALNRHGYTCLQTQNAPAGLPHLQVIAPDALYLTRGGKQRTFTSFGKLLEEIK